MSFDVHELDTFVLVGSAVTLLAILAVRLSSRAGLPSLLIYLLMGVALGEQGFGIHFEDAELAHSLGFAALAIILAEGGLTTSWREMRPSIRLGVSLATVGVGRVGGDRRARRPLPARAAVGARRPARCGDVAHRRRGRVLGAAGGAAAAQADRVARGRVRPQRRTHRRARHPRVERRGRRPRRLRDVRDRRLRARHRHRRSDSPPASAVPGSCAAPRCRRPASTRWPC